MLSQIPTCTNKLQLRSYHSMKVTVQSNIATLIPKSDAIANQYPLIARLQQTLAWAGFLGLNKHCQPHTFAVTNMRLGPSRREDGCSETFSLV